MQWNYHEHSIPNPIVTSRFQQHTITSNNKIEVNMDHGHCVCRTDCGPEPWAVNVERATMQNQNFWTAIWTGCHLQMTLMCIPIRGEIGLECHANTDQMIRIEQGNAVVKMGETRERCEFCQNVSRGDVIFVPAGTWHNIYNAGRSVLKVSSVLCTLTSPHGTTQHTKTDETR